MSDEKSEDRGFTVVDRRAGAEAEPPPPEAPEESESALPKVDFSSFCLSLATSALYHLGVVGDPDTGQATPQKNLPRGLPPPHPLQEQEMFGVGSLVYRVELHARPPLQHPLTNPALPHGLQLAEVCHRDNIREMGLLRRRLQEAHPFPVTMLARLVHQDEIDAPQSRRRSPAHLLVNARAFIPQCTVDRVHLNGLDAIMLRKLRFE